MFMRYDEMRAHRRRSDFAASIALAGGFALATLIAFVGLASAAQAAPSDVMTLATMLAAPNTAAEPALTNMTIMTLMIGGLGAMAAGALALGRTLVADLERAGRGRNR